MNGNGGGFIGKVTDRLVTALPPGLLVLALLNVAVLVIVIWFLNSQMSSRAAIIAHLLENCIGNHQGGRM